MQSCDVLTLSSYVLNGVYHKFDGTDKKCVRRSYTMRISFVSDQAKTKKKCISLTPQRCLLRKYHVCTVPHQKDVREEIWKIGNLSGFWERDIVLSSLC